MPIVMKAAARALASLPSGDMLKILILGMLLNALVLAGLVMGMFVLLAQFNVFGEWDWLADFGLSALAGILAYFLYPLILPLIISFFDTAIADAIEKQDYPELPPAEPPFWPTLAHDLRFTLKALLLNALALPFYLLPGVNLLVYYGLNGYLLGTEFFNIVAGRHISPQEAARLRARHRLTLILAGCLITVCSTIPLVNLIAPIFGVALMVHFFHALRDPAR